MLLLRDLPTFSQANGKHLIMTNSFSKIIQKDIR